MRIRVWNDDVFIYALYCCVNKKYILMVFWLIMLGTTKSSGMLVALCFVGTYLMGLLVTALRDRKRGTQEKPAEDDNSYDTDGDEYNVKTGIVAMAAIAAAMFFVYGVIRVCAANGIAFPVTTSESSLHSYMYLILTGYGL